jgi:rSAM/selenodomain-associated transferase 1
MAKAPQPGKVKTRLSPPLSPEEAMQMSAAFLRDITENIRLAAQDADITGYIAYAPAGLEMLFNGMLAKGTRLVLADGTGAGADADGVAGFGRCLLHATQSLFDRGHSAVCVLNADSPTLPTACLVAAARALEGDGDRAVLGAAEDGGYYLLGMNKVHSALYADIAWSTDIVAEQTRAAAAGLGLQLQELPVWYDVDDRAALLRLLRDLESGAPASPAPATAALVHALKLRERLEA